LCRYAPGEDKLKKLLNFLLIYIANLDIPIKRGTFIEFRNGRVGGTSHHVTWQSDFPR
jgi:hypothetical protein